jgi:hypothetical protein
MLALIIGGMVLTTALATFALLQRADRHNEARLRTARELSGAHRAVELTLRSMILSNTRVPPPPPVTPPGVAALPTPAAPETPEPTEFERPRVILSPVEGAEAMIWRDADGREVRLRPQRLELTVERPPVFAEPLPGETFQPVVHRMYASRRERERDQRRREREDERRTEEGERDAGTFDTREPAIAAGVRGVFELTWEPAGLPRPGETPNPEGGSWALWWRTLPPLASTPDVEEMEGLSDQEIDRNPMYRPVLLASGLRWCRWEAVRAGETLREFQSTWWEDLPAYITLETQTLTGKWAKWMFEVQGTRGPEPGTVTGEETPAASPEGVNATLDGSIEDVSGQERGGTRFRIDLSSPSGGGGKR